MRPNKHQRKPTTNGLKQTKQIQSKTMEQKGNADVETNREKRPKKPRCRSARFKENQAAETGAGSPNTT